MELERENEYERRFRKELKDHSLTKAALRNTQEELRVRTKVNREIKTKVAHAFKELNKL